MKPSAVGTRSVLGLAIIALSAFLACGEGGPTNTENPSISVSIDPTAVSIEQGASADIDVTVRGSGGFSSTATVTVEGVPAGVTGTVGNVQSSGNITTATVTVSVGATVAAGTYTITVRAAGGGVTPVTVTLTLTVTAAPTYTLTATPDELGIEQGAEGTTQIDVDRTNFTGDVTLAVEGAPAGMVTSFDVNPVPGDVAVLTVGVGEGLAAGTYPLTVRGTATGLPDQEVSVSVVVTEPAPPDYVLAITPSALSIQQGDSEDAAVTLTRTNFAGDVTLAAEGVPADVTVTFSENPVADADADMTVSVDASVPTGDYEFTVRGTATGIADKTVTVDLTVEDAVAYTLTVAPTALSVEQDASGTVDITVTRTNFTEDVTLALEGAPENVTGQFSVNPVGGTASVLTIVVGAAVPAGTYDLTVRGTSASLSDETADLTLTVVEPVGFSLDAITPITIQQNASGTRTVTMTRTGGFTDDVTVTVTGLPAGITATVDPVTTAESSVDVTLDVALSVAVGNYSATVRGNAAGQPESTQALEISVTTASGQQVSLDFSVCVADQRPVWFAYRDGAGPWTPVSGSGDVYTFNVSEDMVAIAASVTPGGGPSNVLVYSATRAEAVSADMEELCDIARTGKTVNATVAGINPANLEGATITLGEAWADAAFDGPISIQGVPDGNLDLIGYKWSLASATSRMLIQRDLDPANGANLGTIDFAGASAFDPASATVTLQGGSGGGAWFTEYATAPVAGACHYASLDDDVFVGSSFTVGGAPSGQQQAGDFHIVSVTDGMAYVSETFATLADRTLAFGAALPTPTVTDISGAAAYRRARVELTMPAEYDATTTFILANGGGTASVILIASSAWLGGQSVSMEVPDFTGLAGWSDAWAPEKTSPTDWALSGYGWSGEDCTEGAREVSRTAVGTVG